jgi:hypothetical protein
LAGPAFVRASLNWKAGSVLPASSWVKMASMKSLTGGAKSGTFVSGEKESSL